MSTDIDLHQIIGRLASAEWECPIGEYEYPPTGQHLAECRCGGMGRIVPFASLRKARCTRMTGHYHRTVHYHPNMGRPCNEGWVPEPDVRVACWLASTTKTFAETGHLEYWIEQWQWTLYGWREQDDPPLRYDDPLTAVLRAAEAWLEEKKKETP